MVDNLTPEQRSLTMSRIRSRDTKVEMMVRRALHLRGYRYRVNAGWLPGKPDIVFTKLRLVVFIDGDFWHGWRFDAWSDKLAPYWRAKIAGNLARDERHKVSLRRDGWGVLRIWEHEVKSDLGHCIARIEQRLARLKFVGALRAKQVRPQRHRMRK
ncbi:MAG: very short patch repair endonuclease [Paraburkholderia tropica]|uniref:very short patch repair endonuclease n=1 Tax=Paraburkholderia tropica TaxID=92647 RepID=UPI003100D988